MEIQELQKEGIKRLKQAGIPEARQKANRLLAHLLNLDLVQLIMKEKEFYITPDVLIPQPDTEILVEEALRRLPDNAMVLDLCTGSGCVRYLHCSVWEKGV